MKTRAYVLGVAAVSLTAGVIAAAARINAREPWRDRGIAGVASAAAQDKIDFGVIESIRTEGIERSKAVEIFEYLTTNIGPRLTNSPAHRQAIAWAQQQLKSWGMSEVHTEPFQFGRGWTLNKISVEMVEPRYMPLIGYPRGWSPSTPGDIVATRYGCPDSTTAR